MIYTVNFMMIAFAALIFDLFPDKNLNKLYKPVYFMFFGYLILFAGLRIDTGYDYSTYRMIFDQVRDMAGNIFSLKRLLSQMEIGYLLLNYIFQKMDFQFFVFVFAVIAILPKALYLKKCLSRKFAAMLCFYATVFINFDMGVVRQGMALGIVLWAYEELAHKHYKRFFMITVIASMFHISSAAILVVLIFRDKRLKLWHYVAGLAVSFSISLLHPLLLLAQTVPTGSDNIIFEKLAYYYTFEYEPGMLNMPIYMSVVKRLILLVFFAAAVKKGRIISKDTGRTQLFFNIFYFSIVFSLLAIDISTIAGRGSLYFTITQIFLFEHLMDNDSDLNRMDRTNTVMRRVFAFMLMVILSYNSMHNVIVSPAYTPYRSILDFR